MEQHTNQLPVELSSQLVTIMATEHLTLQTARAMAIAEATGRASLFVGAVSSTLVALALVGQLSHLGTAFFVFSLVIIPTLVLMGLITFERALQAASVNLIYTSGLNRIRHLYVEYAPQMRPTLSSLPMMIGKGSWARKECTHPGGRSSSIPLP